jgi:hypothetical protein
VGEAYLLRYLREVFDARDALPEFQCGLREGHSKTRSSSATEGTPRSFNFKKTAGAAFLAFEKAFGQVWHKGLLH